MDKSVFKMSNVLSKLRPENADNFKNYLMEFNMKKLREDIALFIVQEKGDDFYDLTKFCEKNDIKDGNNYLVKIVDELKVLGWLVGVVFNRTGIVLFKNKGEMEKSYWKSNLDFEIL